jgi:hypothetical protein
MLANFYGDVLVLPTTVAHIRSDLDAAVTQLRQAVQQHQLGDVLVAVEPQNQFWGDRIA